MKRFYFISSIILVSGIIIACTGNSSASNNANDKNSTKEDPVTALTGGTGSDMLYEYKLTSSGNSNTRDAMSIQTDTKMYVSSKGDVRMEMNMASSYQGKNSPTQIVTIGHSDKPNESIYIDDNAKTYSVNHFSDSEITRNITSQTLSVVKAGEEKICGFNSVHARIISKKFMGAYLIGVDTMDIWRSNEVPLVASVKAMLDRFESKLGSGLFSPDVVSQLKQMGCEGFMTKLGIHSKNSTVVEELIKVEHADVPASKYQIPAGYTEDKNGL